MEIRTCQNCKKDFAIEQEDFDFYSKMKVPPPTFCFPCRLQRKLLFCNERSLYKDACSSCGKSTVTMYRPGHAFPMYCLACYASDAWDASDYVQEYDFNQSFFFQMRAFLEKVPKIALDQTGNNGEGCEYSNFCYASSNVYLSYSVVGSENILYSKYVMRGNTSCLDSLTIQENERGYELVQSKRNYNCSFLVDSEQCADSHFLYDCKNCTDCMLSSNQRNKRYMHMNRQLSREAYLEKMKEAKLSSYSGQQAALLEFRALFAKSIHRFAQIHNSADVSGDFIENSKNAHECFGLVDAENCKYIFFGVNKTRDAYDLVFTGRLESCYELSLGGRGLEHVLFCYSCGKGAQNLEYSFECNSCTDCFGCISLKGKSYCIFNKQYSKEEYKSMVEKIKQHMRDMPYRDSAGRIYRYGEFFPAELSLFAYNETVAYEEFPLSKEQVLAAGYRWQERDIKSHEATLDSKDIPESIEDISDPILSETIRCPNQGNPAYQCVSAYRITEEELRLYRLMKIPLPRLCPNCRYYARRVFTNTFHLRKEQCTCTQASHDHVGQCPVTFSTAFPEDAFEKIYCESCYQQEVI